MEQDKTALEALEAIAMALDVPRNRFGKLESDFQAGEKLRELAVRYDCPGAQDIAEQAVQVARAILEDRKGTPQ